MANQPTIVVAKLDDEKLKASIDKMVNDLNAGLNKMTANTDAAVAKMQASLQSAGNIKFGSGGSDGGSSKRTKKQHEEAEAVKQTADAYDKLAQSQQKSTQVKSARESYYAFVRGYKEQANGIASLIRDFENTLTKTIQNRVAEINSQIATSKDKIRALNEELNRRQFAAGNPEAQAQVQRELDKELRTVRELEGQLANVNQQFAFEKTYLASLYGEHYRISNIMREEGEIQRQRVSTENQITAELNKQMQKVFEIDSRKKASSAFQSISDMDSSTLDRAEAKLKALEALKEKVRNTDMFSAKNMQNLEAMISYQKSIVEKHKNAGLGVTKDDEEAIKKAAAAEEQWTEKIKARGQVAQETSRKMLRMLNEEAQAGGKGLMGMYTIDGKEISAVKELSVAIKDMQNAYNKMSDSEKESAIGRALKKDIETTKEAIRVVSAYNAMASGMNRGGVGNQQQQLNIENLRQIIKKLTEDFSKLSIEDVKAGRGNLLIDRIQRTSRALQQLQAQMNRPTSLDKALKLPANTLDEIAYKMQMLSNYRAHLNMFDPKQKEEIDAVNKAIEKLRLEQNKIMGQNKEMLASNNALVRSFNYMKNRLAFYFTVGASTQFVKSLIDIRSQYEMNERALGILINSAERGTQIFKELSEMALVSPYTLIELSSAAKQLVAYDIAAKDVVDTTRRLADMASAVGVPMERLTYALGQIKAYGYLNSRDARMFANAGIPLVKQLADYYTQLEGRIISVGDVYDRMKKKTIDYNDVMAVVTKMTDEGGKFFDFQAKMADSLKVRLANLTLAWSNMMNEIGESRQGMLTATIGGLKELFLHWKEISNVFNGLLLAFGMFKLAQITALAFMGELNTAMGWQVVLGTKLQQKLASLATGYKTLSMGITAAGAAFWVIAADAIMTYNKNIEEIERLNSTIQNGAAEASEALDKLLHSSEMVAAKLSAANGKLSASDATKTWEVLREQIEMSAASSKALIAELVQEEDLNKRVSEAFKLAESIQEATSKLSDLNNALDITQDSILWGAFGEGLVEDIEDYNEHLKQQAEITEWAEKKNKSFFDNAATGIKYLIDSVREDFGSSSEEAETEIRNFAHNAAETIKDELGEKSLKDKVQVNEAVARVIGGIEQMFPQIRGKGKALFEEIFYDVMSKEFEGSVDKQAFYYEKFLERLKKDHASAFGDVTDEILEDTHKWNDAQIDAIKKTAEKIKKDLPEASQNAIDGILYQLNSTEFKLRIVAELSTNSVDEINKQFRNKFIKPQKDALGEQLGEAEESFITRMRGLTPWGDNSYGNSQSKEELENLQKYGTLMRKTDEDDLAYEKRIRDERQKKLDLAQAEKDIIANKLGKEDAGSKAILKNAQETLKATEDWLNAAKEVESWGGYNFSTKKENSAANKAQHEAETELQKALKEELQLIEKVRSAYKTLTKEGMNHLDAITTATSDYEESVTNVNNVLKRYGLELDLSKFAGIENPHGLVVMLQKQLDTLFGKAKPAEIQALQVKIKDIKVDAAAFDQKTFATSLNDQLGKLKDEYELAIALDADPELGESFASLIGLDLDSLPRTVSEYAKRATDYLNEYMDKNKTGIQLPSVELTNQQLKGLKDMVDTNVLNAEVYERIKKVVNEIREARKKEMEEHIKDWNKLIEKYSEYETKIKNIQNTTAKERRELVRTFGNEAQQATAVQLETQIRAENDPAAKQALIGQLADLADQVSAGNPVAVKLKVAITNKNEQGIAKAGFEEFQKSPEWILATGDLATMSTKAIGFLIDKLSDYKKSAKNLDPKQIKQLNNALKSLYKEQRKANPFTAMATAIEQTKENAALFDDKIEDTKSKIKETEKEIAQAEKYGFDTTQMKEQLDSLKNALTELENAKDSFNSIDPSTIVEGINGAIAVAQKASEAFTDMMNALGGKNGSGDAQAISQIFTILGQAGSYAAMGAQIGGAYGAIIGGVLGAVSSVVTMFADEWSGNADITRAVQRSERAVKSLEIAYVDLKHAMDDAYGSAEIGAQRAIITNKELQLVELKRQLQLEESRKGKNRDKDRILELKKQIKELEYDIVDSIKEITNSLLGISSVGNAAETLVTSMITAFRKGEKFMDEYKQSFADMIDNMIMKAIVSNVIGNRLQELFDRIQQTAEDRASSERLAYEQAAKDYARWQKYVESGWFDKFYYFDPKTFEVDRTKEISKEEQEKLWKERLEYLKKQYEEAMTPTPDDVQSVKDDVKNWKDSVKEEFMAYMDAFGIKYGQDSTKQLSALQQGLQGMSESTANSLEAYMNGVSQQVYLQNDLLIQIRDVILGFDVDIQTATLGQILLQLQNSYQVQMSIQNMLEGALNPSGRAFMVELNS